MIKPIAFYLPQFHPIPENDFWWGEGFTEWNNVKAAQPQFFGHHQPHIPHKSIGYYDLRDKYFLKKQHDMALRYGIHGFCYYYYFFNGKKLLETPLKIILSSTDIANNFCLCWANGNWTRAWYGQNKEILISNEYNPSNALKFINSLLPFFKDNRYIRVDGKPLLLVYEPEAIPTCQEYSNIWRQVAKKSGLPGIYLVAVEALMYGENPQTYGFDAAVEFAPDWTKVHQLSKPGDHHRIFDYHKTVKNMILKTEVDYERFHCVFPSWDNTPRYKKSAITFINNTTGTFKYFLSAAMKKTKKKFPKEKQFLFINAWNEWGEGCHLEPDAQNNFTYLQTLLQVIREEA